MPKVHSDLAEGLQKERMLKMGDVQQECNVSRSMAYKMLDEGLPFVRLGTAIRVRESALRRFLAERESSATD